MSENRLNGLALLNIHNDIDNKNIKNKYIKPRTIRFIYQTTFKTITM